ncbi:MAG: DsbA family protein [Bdellovibrionales bacterium]|nr:DsbA family protein [Bdellovibrionales bacterium]MBT3527252.1 DsbA family protein [Bdellovibrionales bacterium]MBT7668403.1 DsbA family protein [Bdellovibrionales bacterium]MBT7767891.1 DsbA family protein [Bdellovibrionales bacterium]
MRSLLLFIMSVLVLAGCQTNMKDEVSKVIEENPEILIKAIEAKPAEFVMAFQKAVKNAQGALAEKKRKEEEKQLEERYDNPLKPVIRSDESIRGTKGAPLVLIEYSDFECPFCSRGFDTVRTLLEKYDGKLQFVYKHLPLSFHPSAMIAAQYYEAIRLQSEDKAFKFHDAIFANQRKLKNGEKFLKKTAKKLKLNMKKLATDIKSKKVMDRIKSDQQEASKFGMQGTPGFILNGIPVKGAYPPDYFVGIVDQLVKRGKVKL